MERDAMHTLLTNKGIGIWESDSWEMPPLVLAMRIDNLQISKLALTLFCAIRLNRLPMAAAMMINLLSLSENIELNGSAVELSSKSFSNVQGSVADFLKSLWRDYVGDALVSLGSVLGNSSLLNIPRAPFNLASFGAQAFSGAVGNTVGGAASGMDDMLGVLTADAKYAEKRREQRNKKKVTNFATGFAEAGHELTSGLVGVFDVVRKPVEGAKKGGLGGFLGGIGTGLVSGVMKPLSGIGQAATDITGGVAAQLHHVTTKEREVTAGWRLARALAGNEGAIIEYSELHTLVVERLGAHGKVAEVVVPLASSAPSAASGPSRASRSDQSFASASSAPAKRTSMTPEMENKVIKVATLVCTPAQVILLDVELPARLAEDGPDAALLRQLRGAPGAPWPGRSGVRWTQSLPLQRVEFFSGPQGDGQTFIELQAKGQPDKVLLPVPPDLGGDLVQAIFDALRDASVDFDWTERIRRALSQSRRSVDGQRTTALSTTCIVMEVERATFPSGMQSEWVTPFLPAESAQWLRWMDANLLKEHPQLDRDRKSQWANIKSPPIFMPPIWEPVGSWQKVKNDETDGDGWQYSNSWTSGMWHKYPRMLVDTVRRRRWECEYKLADKRSG